MPTNQFPEFDPIVYEFFPQGTDFATARQALHRANAIWYSRNRGSCRAEQEKFAKK